jgi:hypothetical protein
VEHLLDKDLGYTGALVLAPEGHKWRDVYHAHVLAEHIDWGRLHAAYHAECGAGNLQVGKATGGAVAYACKYSLKSGSEHIVIRRSNRGGLFS